VISSVTTATANNVACKRHHMSDRLHRKKAHNMTMQAETSHELVTWTSVVHKIISCTSNTS